MAAGDGILHTIELGDTTSGLAFENGLLPQTVWDHPRNQQLKQMRENMNVLNPGDQLFVPERREKQVAKPVDQRHKFKRKGIPEVFRMQFVDYDKTPLANEPYRLIVDGQIWKTGSLDSEGWVRTPIPAGARQGEIGIGEGYSGIVLALDFGYLNPIADLTGVQARLRNLGYFDGAEDGKDSPELREAVRRFRKDRQLPDGEEIDAALRDELKKQHLS